MDHLRDGCSTSSRFSDVSRWIMPKTRKKRLDFSCCAKLNFRIFVMLTIFSTSIVCSKMPDKYPIEVYHMLREKARFGLGRDNREEGSWGPWSAWSECSRTCGTGVQSQARECLPVRQLLRKRSTISNNNTINTQPVCVGTHKRYHICNTQECPNVQDIRSEQCAKFNGRIYKGRTYTWVPFLDAPNSCALNCRAVGERFYATLEPTIMDGTPCDGSNFRRHGSSIYSNNPEQWLCVAGQCKPVGCDGVVGSGATVDACGVCGGQGEGCRLYEGIFMEPLLSKGHQSITTIPKGSMSVNISELRYSGNFLALKAQNGSYILNGPWAFSPSGTYKAAGTTLTYQRGDRSRMECILATGPLNESLYLEILYNEMNPGVLYKYMLPLTEDSERNVAGPPLYFPGPTDRGNEIPDSSGHMMTVSVSKMIDQRPKMLNMTYGFNHNEMETRRQQPKDVLKYRTTKPMVGDQPNTKRKKRKFNWKVIGFSPCSRICGGGLQNAIIKCVRESNQIIVTDRRCHRSEKIPSPPPKVCNERPCIARWKAEAWSDCSVTCGSGIRTRKLDCIQELNSKLTMRVAASACVQPPNLRTVESCTKPACNSNASPELRHMHTQQAAVPRWDVGSWEPCSSSCGLGTQNRTVTCITSGEPCTQSTRPESEKSCELTPCRLNKNDHASWLYSEWSSKCSMDCGIGVEHRQVACSDGSELFCNHDKKPATERQCLGKEPKCNQAKWFTGPWTSCSKTCGTGVRHRDVICVAIIQGDFKVLLESNCSRAKPFSKESCSNSACLAQWLTSDWSECSVTCGGGTRSRLVRCVVEGVNTSNCTESLRPAEKSQCNQQLCQTPEPPTVRPLTTLMKDASNSTECIDKYPSCSLAVKNRLCRIKYYKHSCCGCLD